MVVFRKVDFFYDCYRVRSDNHQRVGERSHIGEFGHHGVFLVPAVNVKGLQILGDVRPVPRVFGKQRGKIR